MTDQIVEQPALERGKPAMNGHTAPQAATPARTLRPRLIAAGGLLIASLAGFGLWHVFLAGPGVSPDVIAVSGRIEGNDSAVAAKTSGGIREITVREGDRIEAGHVIATLDDLQIRAREQPAEARAPGRGQGGALAPSDHRARRAAPPERDRRRAGARGCRGPRERGRGAAGGRRS